jgi:two-component system nitrogen regulation sensor histidine kinase NtrY
MIYKRLLTGIIIRILLLTLTLSAMVYFWLVDRDPLILLNLFVVLVLQVILFIRSQNQVNRKLKIFFESFRYDDLALTSREGFSDRSFRDLYSAMSDILKTVRKMNLENLRQKQYFQSVTEHAGVGIMAVNEKGEVKLVNQTLKKMLHITELEVLGDMEKVREGLTGQLEQISPGDQKLIRLSVRDPSDLTGESRMQLSIRCSEIRLEKERIRLLTFQNIREELEEMEIESWQKVIRVLTHEITNSTGPIASAAQTLLELLEGEEIGDIRISGRLTHLKEDLVEGLWIIRERSLGMEEFVQQFRKVTLVKEPELEKIRLDDLFSGIFVLFEKSFKEKGIAFERSIESPDMVLYADRNLVEQALINLVGNAIHAMSSSPVRNLHLDARIPPGRQCLISLSDTGRGICEEDLDRVFIPFFTTREGGSGIGLSLVRNIMRMHRGSIQVTSDPGRNTTFSLLF